LISFGTFTREKEVEKERKKEKEESNINKGAALAVDYQELKIYGFKS